MTATTHSRLTDPTAAIEPAGAAAADRYRGAA
jgi:hypothetical protein